MERLALRVVLTGDKLGATNNIGGSECGGSVLPDGQHTQVILHPWNQICDHEGPVSHWNHPEKKTKRDRGKISLKDAKDSLRAENVLLKQHRVSLPWQRKSKVKHAKWLFEKDDLVQHSPFAVNEVRVMK